MRLSRKDTFNWILIEKFPRIVQLILEKYATDEIFVATESATAAFSKTAVATARQVAEMSVAKQACCGEMLEKFELNEIFAEDSNAPVHQSILELWSEKIKANKNWMNMVHRIEYKTRGNQTEKKKNNWLLFFPYSDRRWIYMV